MAEPMPAPAFAARWDGALLATVAEINELMLESLRQAAEPSHPCPTRDTPRLVAALPELWRALDALAQQRLARCPYLLLDAGFATPQRWQRDAWQSGVREGSGAARGYFAGPVGVALVRRTLVFAWHLARSHRLTARVLLGMSAECAERIGASALRDLEAVAELRPEWIAPRWEGQPHIWRQLMQAAVDGREDVLRPVQLRGLQLLAAAS